MRRGGDAQGPTSTFLEDGGQGSLSTSAHSPVCSTGKNQERKQHLCAEDRCVPRTLVHTTATGDSVARVPASSGQAWARRSPTHGPEEEAEGGSGLRGLQATWPQHGLRPHTGQAVSQDRPARDAAPGLAQVGMGLPESTHPIIQAAGTLLATEVVTCWTWTLTFFTAGDTGPALPTCSSFHVCLRAHTYAQAGDQTQASPAPDKPHPGPGLPFQRRSQRVLGFISETFPCSKVSSFLS